MIVGVRTVCSHLPLESGINPIASLLLGFQGDALLTNAVDAHVVSSARASEVCGRDRWVPLPVTGHADPATRQVLGLDDQRHGFTLQRGDGDFPEDFSLHGFRHTCVSLVVAAGANVKAAQSFAGHASASMTLDTYSHLFNDDLESVAEVLGTIVDSAQGDQQMMPELQK